MDLDGNHRRHDRQPVEHSSTTIHRITILALPPSATSFLSIYMNKTVGDRSSDPIFLLIPIATSSGSQARREDDPEDPSIADKIIGRAERNVFG